MSDDEPVSFLEHVKKWINLGQGEIIRTSKIGKRMIQGSILHEELKNTYQEIGKLVYECQKNGEASIEFSDLKKQFSRIEELKEKINLEEQSIQTIKKSNRSSQAAP